jgi:hypothetical protein
MIEARIRNHTFNEDDMSLMAYIAYDPDDIDFKIAFKKIDTTAVSGVERPVMGMANSAFDRREIDLRDNFIINMLIDIAFF